jgi:hypothetical protein
MAVSKKAKTKTKKSKDKKGVYATTQNVVVSANIHRDLPLETPSSSPA